MMNKKVFTTTATMFVLLAGILAMTTPANVVHAQQFHGKDSHIMADIMVDIVMAKEKEDTMVIPIIMDIKADMDTMDMDTMDMDTMDMITMDMITMDMITDINTATIHGITDTNIYTAMVLVTTTTTTTMTTTTTINLPWLSDS